MEDTHGVQSVCNENLKNESLNPYYNGRYSWSSIMSFNEQKTTSLNPYYNGRYSWRALLSQKTQDQVLS